MFKTIRFLHYIKIMISINDNNTNLINNQVSTSILIIGSDSKFIWEFCKINDNN